MTTQHERDKETGLDYRGARFYDSDIARFLSLDPLAKQFPAWSAYNYVMGNPISLIDPTGRSPEGTGDGGGGAERLSGWSRFKNWISGDSHKNWVNKLASDNGLQESDISLHDNQEVAAFMKGNTLNVQSRNGGYIYSEVSPFESGEMMFSLYRSNFQRDVRNSDFGENGFNWDNLNVQNYLVHAVGPDIGGPAKGLNIIKGATTANRLNYIFGKSEHALEGLVQQFGSQKKAYNAVQKSAHQALKNGLLTPNAKGILPSGNAGNIINVGGNNVRLIGGRVVDGKVILSSFSRKGL